MRHAGRKKRIDGQEIAGNMNWGRERMELVLPWVSDDLRDCALEMAYRKKAEWRIPAGNMPIEIEFCPPDDKERDLAELFYAIRPALEGLAEAVRLDSSVFFPITLTWGAIFSGQGKIVLTVGR